MDTLADLRAMSEAERIKRHYNFNQSTEHAFDLGMLIQCLQKRKGFYRIVDIRNRAAYAYILGLYHREYEYSDSLAGDNYKRLYVFKMKKKDWIKYREEGVPAHC